MTHKIGQSGFVFLWMASVLERLVGCSSRAPGLGAAPAPIHATSDAYPTRNSCRMSSAWFCFASHWQCFWSYERWTGTCGRDCSASSMAFCPARRVRNRLIFIASSRAMIPYQAADSCSTNWTDFRPVTPPIARYGGRWGSVTARWRSRPRTSKTCQQMISSWLIKLVDN